RTRPPRRPRRSDPPPHRRGAAGRRAVTSRGGGPPSSWGGSGERAACCEVLSGGGRHDVPPRSEPAAGVGTAHRSCRRIALGEPAEGPAALALERTSSAASGGRARRGAPDVHRPLTPGDGPRVLGARRRAA